TPGVAYSLSMTYSSGVASARIDLAALVRAVCANPSRVFGLWGRKGDLAPGFAADLVLFDPGPRWTLTAGELHSRAGFSPYEGMELVGKVETTIARGEVVYDQARVCAQP